jgi:hypothetical protein
MTDHSAPRRRFQFRLRTLLIVVTVVAVLCSVVAWYAKERERLIERREQLIRDLQKEQSF